MADGQMPPDQSGGAPAQGASQLVADVHSSLLKLQELLSGKFPDLADKLGEIIQAYQSLVDELGQPAGAEPPGPQGNVPPMAGAGKVRQVL